jgi:hypothetical protein
MEFKKAYEAMKTGGAVKLPEWKGYWKYENGTIMMYCKDGEVIDIRETDNVDYTLTNILRDDWELVHNVPALLDIQTFAFGEALRNVRAGRKIARKGWNGKDMFVVYQKGYPEGIECNKQTAEAWGLNEGDLFKCNPYLQIKCADGSHSMWVPSINDVLAYDWYVIK